MIKREELLGKSQQELQEMMESDLRDFSAMAAELTEEEVIEQEQQLMEVMNENEEFLKTVTYQLPTECEFDGTVYKADTITKQIAEMIENNEVEWSYTLGMYDLCKLWRGNIMEIPYHAYDSTLRILGGMKYKGREQWRKILTINDFLHPSHEEYVKDTSYTLYLSSRHNVLIDMLKKFNPNVMEAEAEEDTNKES